MPSKKRELADLRATIACAVVTDTVNDTPYQSVNAIPESVWQRLCQLDPVIAAATYRAAREGVRQYRKATREARQ